MPRGRPRHEARFIELSAWQCSRISLTASTDTADPQRFKWLWEMRKTILNKSSRLHRLQLTSKGFHHVYQLMLSRHYQVDPAPSPMQGQIQSNCAPISMRWALVPICMRRKENFRNKNLKPQSKLTPHPSSPNTLIKRDVSGPRQVFGSNCRE